MTDFVEGDIRDAVEGTVALPGAVQFVRIGNAAGNVGEHSLGNDTVFVKHGLLLFKDGFRLLRQVDDAVGVIVFARGVLQVAIYGAFNVQHTILDVGPFDTGQLATAEANDGAEAVGVDKPIRLDLATEHGVCGAEQDFQVPRLQAALLGFAGCRCRNLNQLQTVLIDLIPVLAAEGDEHAAKVEVNHTGALRVAVLHSSCDWELPICVRDFGETLINDIRLDPVTHVINVGHVRAVGAGLLTVLQELAQGFVEVGVIGATVLQPLGRLDLRHALALLSRFRTIEAAAYMVVLDIDLPVAARCIPTRLRGQHYFFFHRSLSSSGAAGLWAAPLSLCFYYFPESLVD